MFVLNEAPKKTKNKDYSNPTKWQLFWRIQRESWRRMITPYLMYLFMSMLMLACQTFGPNWLHIVLGVLCILGGAFFNGHLCFNYGKLHYGAYVAGCLHRRNAVFGIQSGGDHRPEREYRAWKGFYIGFLVGIPALILAILAGFFPPDGSIGTVAYIAYAMFAGYAIIPITWGGAVEGQGTNISPFWSILFLLLPILVSGVMYIVGAHVEEKSRAREAERLEQVASAGKKNKGKKK